MKRLRVRGADSNGNVTPLSGTVQVSGAKNSALIIMMGSLVTDQPVQLDNIPRLQDIETSIELLEILGATVRREHGSHCDSLYIQCQGDRTEAPYDIVRKMRASNLVLGPLLGRFGYAKVSLPGGCAIGARPMDLHLQVIEKTGARVVVDGGYIIAEAPSEGLKPVQHIFPQISVGATENSLMLLSLVSGTSVLDNCAREPEVVQLCQFLVGLGVSIDGIGSSRLVIRGGKKLGGARISIIPDRIEAGTLLVAGAITGGSVTVQGIGPESLESTLQAFRSMGCEVTSTPDSVSIKGRPTSGIDLSTTPFPGFPTDMQAQVLALCAVAPTPSTIREMIFENRFMHVPEMNRLGARIQTSGNVAIVEPAERLSGATVMASDLRASAGLVLLGLAAQGETIVRRIYHLDRGYERLEEKLNKLGANITREDE